MLETSGIYWQSATGLNQPVTFDTSSVTGMQSMFYGASAFNQPLPFDTSSVTTMNGMLGRATAFNQPLTFDTSSVTRMSYMFYNDVAFNQPLSFDVSGVTNAESCPNNLCMYYMFGVRSAQYPVRIPQSRPAPLHEPLCTAATPQTPSPNSWPAPGPASLHALVLAWQVTNSLSAANKRLIGCAWASSTAFNTAGYSSWANSCPA